MTDHTIAALVYEAMLWGNDQPKRTQGITTYIPFGNSVAEIEARRFTDRIVDLIVPEHMKAEAKAEGMRHAANIAWSIGGKDHPDSIAYDVEKAILDAIPKGN